MAKKIKRYDGEEGSYVSDDDLDQRVYSSRGTGAGLSDDEEGGGLREMEYKSEPRSASVSKKASSPTSKKTSSSVFKSNSVGPSRGNEDIDGEDTSAYHGLPSRKYLKNMPSVSKSNSVGPSRGNEDIDGENTSAYHGLPSRKYLKNMPSSEKKQANADRIQKGAEIGASMLPVGRAIKGIGMVGKAASEVPGFARAVGESGAKAVKQGVKKLQSLKSGGSVRGHGIESRGKTKGRFV